MDDHPENKLPIIYVRGFAGGQGAIDSAVDSPLYGFNDGAVHVRVGANGTPRFYQYEGPILRLIQEEGYVLNIQGDQRKLLDEAQPNNLAPASIWVYRFYDTFASTLGAPGTANDYELADAAQKLAAFIELVREKTVGHPKVYLVSHSMGGLICRTALQVSMTKPLDSVSKLCTIGTPHGGIDPTLGGPLGGWVIDKFGPMGSRIFSPNYMREYMYPVDRGPENDDTRRMVGDFGPDRVLSIVGTNARDYDVAGGLSALAMGVQSDGLVAIKNAYVVGSARSYVHRSHSGRYGLVNSEEAYQNLKRFLFGTLRVEVGIEGLVFEDNRVWQAEVRLAIRQLPVLIHEQTADHYCPVDLNAEAKKVATSMAPLPLITTFLIPNPENRARYALDLKLISLEESNGFFGLGDHLEQIGDWQDSLIVDVQLNDDGALTDVDWDWNSNLRARPGSAELTNPLPWREGAQTEGGWNVSVSLPEVAQKLLGTEARLTLRVGMWSA